ncbi:hypothetical protein NG99_24090 [Erwinia typographi]|uniref:Chitin-binding protein n=1 Tax=Erwinia typographi TaxID=371042 RepID=A0A0A3YP12_9GAMM|nr:N-acetylglucosamine-binding protein GbpA [Erwinia typographi]KGT87066.1 hypothetical protein NG99_24090 [Erwinia typographi]
MKLKILALAVSALTVTGAWAHGYIQEPASRAYQCKLGQNLDCGNVTWEPQSVEQGSGFPSTKLPLDGELASASIPTFSQLNRQSMDAWAKTPIKAGKQKFTWNHTAPHKTTSWTYYITKQDWDANKPLTRGAFELTPFCTVQGNNKVPEHITTQECNVPERTGYQVIYGVWRIADTANSFYQVIDVDFGGKDNDQNQAPVENEWKQVDGVIYGKDLKVGDTVSISFFDKNGVIKGLNYQLYISNKDLTDKNRWSKALAEVINQQSQGLFQAGVMNSTTKTVEPVFGHNYLFIRSDLTALKNFALSYKESQTPAIQERIALTHFSAGKIMAGKSEVKFNADVSGRLNIEAKVYDKSGLARGYLKTEVNNTNRALSIQLEGIDPGDYILKVIATNANGDILQPDSINFKLEQDTAENTTPVVVDDLSVFPANMSSYKAGTRVMHPRNWTVYECLPFPNSGYCKQWSKSANQFEPGVGTN